MVESSDQTENAVKGIEPTRPCALLPRPQRQHSGRFTAKPPRLVSLYLALISSPVCRIAAMQLSSGMKCQPSTPQRQRGGRDRLGGPDAVALDAGPLDQAGHRVAGHAEMVLERDL